MSDFKESSRGPRFFSQLVNRNSDKLLHHGCGEISKTMHMVDFISMQGYHSLVEHFLSIFNDLISQNKTIINTSPLKNSSNTNHTLLIPQASS